MKRRYSSGRKKYKIQRTIRPKPNPELKKAFMLMPAAALDSVGTAWREVDIVGPIVPGAGVTNRIGRRIQIHSFRFRGVLTGGANGSGPVDEYYNNIRLMIYVTTATKSGIALTPASTAGYVLNTPLNKNYMPSLQKVLYDKIYGMTNQPWASNSCAPATREIDFYKRFKKPLICMFTGDTVQFNQTQINVSMVTDSTVVPHPGFSSGYIEVGFFDY